MQSRLKRILLLDDNPLMLSSLGQLLERHSYDVLPAENASFAGEVLSGVKLDLMLGHAAVFCRDQLLLGLHAQPNLPFLLYGQGFFASHLLGPRAIAFMDTTASPELILATIQQMIENSMNKIPAARPARQVRWISRS